MLRLLWGVALIAAFVSCSQAPQVQPSSAGRGEACSSGVPCIDGLSCVEGACHELCNQPSDCPAPEGCRNGSCRDCRDDSQCADGLICQTSTGNCLTTCQSDLDCQSQSYCDLGAGTCLPILSLGEACDRDRQCGSSACAEGVCCDTACGQSCLSCLGALTGSSNGQCDLVLFGFERADECAGAQVCDGSGACGPPPGQSLGASCSQDGQCNSDHCVAGLCCDDVCTGVCNACDPLLTYGSPGRCLPIAVGLERSDECPGAPACDGTGSCFAGGLGAACDEAFECADGFCVDGLCCDNACSGACDTCRGLYSIADDGLCAAVGRGLDPDDECNFACSGGTGFGCQLDTGLPCDADWQCASSRCGPAGCETPVDFGDEIGRSLLFDSTASQFLSRGVSTASDRRRFTFSAWLRRGKLGGTQYLFAADTGGGGESGRFAITLTNDHLVVSSATIVWRDASTLLRDPGAWMHVVVGVDTTHPVSSERLRLEVNGALVTAYTASVDPTLNLDTAVNGSILHYIGRDTTPGGYFDGALAQVIFVDGAQLPAASLGRRSPESGAWVPRDFAGNLGSNGFTLDFADATSTVSLGYDRGANANHWTLDGMSLANQLLDSPTHTFATMNGLDKTVGARIDLLASGNLASAPVPAGPNASAARASLPIPATGRWYVELRPNAATHRLGVALTSTANFTSAGVWTYDGTGSVTADTTIAPYGDPYGADDTVGMLVDADLGAVWFHIDGVWQGGANLGEIAAGDTSHAAFVVPTGAPLAVVWSAGSGAAGGQINFGQRLSGWPGLALWGAAGGSFAFDPPPGARALSTVNLPAPSITRPADHVATITYTGTGTIQSVGGVDFSPDLVILKSRTPAAAPIVFDTVRGPTQRLFTSANSIGASLATSLTSFDTGGFTLGSDVNANQAGTTYVGWLWERGSTPGFDIVTYTGDLSATRAIPHNLGVEPSLVIVKNTTGAVAGWPVYHRAIDAQTPEGFYVALNTTTVPTASATVWGDTRPNAQSFFVGADALTNQTSTTYVAYLFAEVPGFSSFGGYTGSAAVDGPFVNTGCAPGWVLVKNLDAAAHWAVFDSARDENPNTLILYLSLTNAEAAGHGLDLLSNGFKVRGSAAPVNAAGRYIYAAFAAAPTVYSTGR